MDNSVFCPKNGFWRSLRNGTLQATGKQKKPCGRPHPVGLSWQEGEGVGWGDKPVLLVKNSTVPWRSSEILAFLGKYGQKDHNWGWSVICTSLDRVKHCLNGHTHRKDRVLLRIG